LARADHIISLSALARIQPWQERLGIAPGRGGAVWLPGPDQATEEARTRLYWHRHPELEANLVLSGHGTYLVGDRLVPFAAGSVVWLFPGQDHCVVRASADLRTIIAVWRRELIRGCGLGATALAQDDPAGTWSRTLPTARFRAELALCREVAAAQGGAADAGLAWLLHRLWDDYHAAPVGAGPGDLHPGVALVARLLADPACDDIPLPALATRAGLSPDHLGRLFRRQLGCTPVDYRQRRRLDRFLGTLKPGQSVLAAALAAGFGSYAQFHRVFRRHLGVGPRAWLAGDGRRDPVTHS